MPSLSPNGDAYGWVGSSGALWGVAANWQNLTSGVNPGGVRPGLADPGDHRRPVRPDLSGDWRGRHFVQPGADRQCGAIRRLQHRRPVGWETDRRRRRVQFGQLRLRRRRLDRRDQPDRQHGQSGQRQPGPGRHRRDPGRVRGHRRRRAGRHPQRLARQLRPRSRRQRHRRHRHHSGRRHDGDRAGIDLGQRSRRLRLARRGAEPRRGGDAPDRRIALLVQRDRFGLGHRWRGLRDRRRPYRNRRFHPCRRRGFPADGAANPHFGAGRDHQLRHRQP